MTHFYDTWWFWTLTILTCPVWLPIFLFMIYLTVVSVAGILISPFVLLTAKLKHKN